jgi:hypothetical protein
MPRARGRKRGHRAPVEALLSWTPRRMRTAQAVAIIRVRGLVVHGLSPAAERFYGSAGFQESPTNPVTLMIALKDVAAG